MVVALAIVAAIGDVGRFEQSQKLVSYLGLNPSVRQSGPGPAYHGWITKQGRGHARGHVSSRRLGRQRERRVRCVRSSCESAPAAISMSPLSRPPVSSRCQLALAEQRRELRVGPAGVAWRGKLRDLEPKARRQGARGQRGGPTRTISRATAIRRRRWGRASRDGIMRASSLANPRGPKQVRTGAATEVRR